MNKDIKRYSAFLLLAVLVSSQVWGIETSRHMERIIEKLPCELPESGTFTCSQLNIGRPIYVERQGNAVTQIGVRLFDSKIRSDIDEVVCNAIERLWLELWLCEDLQKQKALIKEYRFSIVYNGFTLGTPQFPALSVAQQLFTPDAFVSTNHAEGKIIFRVKYDENALIITLPADRELLYAYDKKEHEDVLKEALLGWSRSYRRPSLPSLEELAKLSDDVYILPGRAYMIDSLKDESFYTISEGRVMPLFAKQYPTESLQNLIMGFIPMANVDLHVRYRTYEREKIYCDMSLNHFLGFMQSQGMDFYAASYNTDGTVQCLLLMHHPVYDYIHMLVVNAPDSLYTGVHTVLEGDFYTFIPQHNIKSLFNF